MTTGPTARSTQPCTRLMMAGSVALAFLSTAGAPEAHALPKLDASPSDAFTARVDDDRHAAARWLPAHDWAPVDPASTTHWAAAAEAPETPVLPLLSYHVPVAEDGAIRLEQTIETSGPPFTRQKAVLRAGFGGGLLASSEALAERLPSAERLGQEASDLLQLPTQRMAPSSASRIDLAYQVLAIICLIGLMTWRKLGTASGYPR